MKSTFDSKHPQTANHSKATFFVLIQTFATALFLLALVSSAHAAITWDGEIDPSNPTTWTTSTIGCIGISSMGTISVDDASELFSKDGYLGYHSGSNGTAKVTGNGSKWTHFQDFCVGNSGTGILNIESG
jgi:T5SS/PEP-CTERM-associated repeat protein